MTSKHRFIGSWSRVVLFAGALAVAHPLSAQEVRLESREWMTVSHEADPARADSTTSVGQFSPQAAQVLQGGSRPWWEYPLWGVPIGGALGLAAFYIEDAIEPCQDGDMLSCKAGMVIYTVGGAAIGGTLGALIGLVVLIRS